jgi:hypothetical protein
MEEQKINPKKTMVGYKLPIALRDLLRTSAAGRNMSMTAYVHYLVLRDNELTQKSS